MGIEYLDGLYGYAIALPRNHARAEDLNAPATLTNPNSRITGFSDRWRRLTDEVPQKFSASSPSGVVREAVTPFQLAEIRLSKKPTTRPCGSRSIVGE
jgi:hypothetical protein